MTTPAEREAFNVTQEIFNLLDRLYELQQLNGGAMVLCGHDTQLQITTVVSMRYVPGLVQPEQLFENLEGPPPEFRNLSDKPKLAIVPKE